MINFSERTYKIIYAFVLAESRKNFCVSILSICLLIYLVFVFVMSTKSLVITFSPHDTFFLLDGAWRIYEGGIPNIDFHDVIGPLSYAIVAFGMKLHGPNSMAVMYGSAALFAVFIFMVWIISITRMSPILAVVFSIISALGIIGNFGIGYPEISYIGIYNRYAYSFLSGVFIYSFLDENIKCQNFRSALNIASNIIAGIFLMAILLTKLTFFPIALSAIILRSVFFKLRAKDLMEILMGSTFFLIFCNFWFGFNPIGFFHDMKYLSMIGHNQTFAIIYDIFKVIFYNKYRLLILLTGLYWVLRIFSKNYLVQRKNMLWVATFFIFMNIADICIAATNTQNFTLWLTPLIIAIISLNIFRYCPEFSFKVHCRLRSLGLFIFSLSILISLAIVIWRELPSLISQKNINLNIPEERVINGKYLSDLYLPKDMVRPNEINFVERLNNGFELLHGVKNLSHQRIVNLDFSNPFNFALGIRSPNGVLLYLHLNKSFDMLTNVEPAREFKDVSIIMIPSESVSGNYKELWQIYGGYISENFHLEVESKHWRIFLKNSSQ